MELLLSATQTHRSKWQQPWNQNVISRGVQTQLIPVNSNCTHCQGEKASGNRTGLPVRGNSLLLWQYYKPSYLCRVYVHGFMVQTVTC